MAAHLRGDGGSNGSGSGSGQGHGISQAIKDRLGMHKTDGEERESGRPVLVNRAGESKSPYVRGHANNPVAWQLWGNEAIELAKKENRLLFVSIGYSACHCKLFRFSLYLNPLAQPLLLGDDLIHDSRVPCYGTGIVRE